MNWDIAIELRKQIITKFKNHAIYSSFKGNVRGGYVSDMHLVSKYNKRV